MHAHDGLSIVYVLVWSLMCVRHLVGVSSSRCSCTHKLCRHGMVLWGASYVRLVWLFVVLYVDGVCEVTQGCICC